MLETFFNTTENRQKCPKLTKEDSFFLINNLHTVIVQKK